MPARTSSAASGCYAGSSPCGTAPRGHVWSFQLARCSASWTANAAAAWTACLVVCPGMYPTFTVVTAQSHAGYSPVVSPSMIPASRPSSSAVRSSGATWSGQWCSCLTVNTKAGETTMETWPNRGLLSPALMYLPSPRVCPVHRTTVGESHFKAGNRDVRRSRSNVATRFSLSHFQRFSSA